MKYGFCTRNCLRAEPEGNFDIDSATGLSTYLCCVPAPITGVFTDPKAKCFHSRFSVELFSAKFSLLRENMM